MDDGKRPDPQPSVFATAKAVLELAALPFRLFFGDPVKNGFMAPTRIPPYTPYWGRNPVSGNDWLEIDFLLGKKPLSEACEWKVVTLTQYKSRDGFAYHEFNIAKFERVPPSPDDDNVFYLRYDRYISEYAIGFLGREDGSPGTELSRKSGSLGGGKAKADSRLAVTSLSSIRVARDDRIAALTEKGRDAAVREQNARRMRTLTFNKSSDKCPTILDLACVVEIHSKKAPSYFVYSTMCWWLAGSTFDAMAHMFGGTVDVHDPTFGTTGGRVPLRFYSSKLLNHAAAINAEARVLEAAIKTDEARQAIPDLLNKFREQLVSLPTFDDLVTTSQLRITEVKGILSQYRTAAEVARLGADQLAEAVAEEAQRGADRLDKANQQLAEANRKLQAAGMSPVGPQGGASAPQQQAGPSTQTYPPTHRSPAAYGGARPPQGLR